MEKEKTKEFMRRHSIAVLYRKAVNIELSKMGLGEIGHPVLLMLLSEFETIGEMSQKFLADAMGVSPPAVTNSLKSLEKFGFIARKRDICDARKNSVVLSESGKMAVEKCYKAFEIVEKSQFVDISQEELEILESLHKRMAENLKKEYSK